MTDRRGHDAGLERAARGAVASIRGAEAAGHVLRQVAAGTAHPDSLHQALLDLHGDPDAVRGLLRATQKALERGSQSA